MLESRYLFQNSHKLILGILLSIFFSIIVILYRDLIIDDAFITFQYARNFAEHFKPWYNLDPFYQGNGQTSILWMLLLSVFNLLGVASEHIFYIINLFLGYFLIYQFVNYLFKDKLSLFEIIYKIAFLVFFSFWMGLNATHGLETLLSTVILLMFLKNWKKPNNYWSLLMLLVRPEFALYLVFWILDSNFKQTKILFRKVVFAAGAFLLIAIFYLSFFDYYIPLPLVLKSQSGDINFIGIKVLIGYFMLFTPIIVSLYKQKRYIFLAPLVLFLFYYTFGLNSYSGGIYIRYFFPLLAYFFFIDFKIKINQWLFTIFCLFSILRMVDLAFNFNEDRKYVIEDNIGFRNGYEKLGKQMKPTDKVLSMEAGQVAYFSKATVYDGLGLNDATLLLANKNNDGIAYKKYVDDRGINIVALVSESEKKFIPRHDSALPYNCLNIKSKKHIMTYPIYNNLFLFVYQY